MQASALKPAEDLDLDRDEIGGLVAWDSPAKTDLVEGKQFSGSVAGFGIGII